jgi:hypothetical protein
MLRNPTIPIAAEEAIIRQVAREYSTLSYLSELVDLLAKLCPQETFEGHSKLQLHNKLNEIIINKHTGEPLLKYKLYNEFFNKNVVAAFEVRVNKSRADFLTVNGVSKSFEIKSELDTLCKLRKQAGDYEKVFDYNHIVTDVRHLASVEKIVPCNFGIWSYDQGKKKVHRKARENNAIEPEMQLRLLTKKELQTKFKIENGERRKILKNHTANDINKKFKQVLKDRYYKRWNFIVEYRNDILPLDLQFFFNTNIQPKYIYYY